MRKRSNNTPAFARADCKAGFFYYINKVLSDSDKLIILKIVTDGVGESGASAIMYRRGVDTSARDRLASKILSFETKINRDLFGSLLTYSYLCTVRMKVLAIRAESPGTKRGMSRSRSVWQKWDGIASPSGSVS